jgi:hypothetical protein
MARALEMVALNQEVEELMKSLSLEFDSIVKLLTLYELTDLAANIERIADCLEKWYKPDESAL